MDNNLLLFLDLSIFQNDGEKHSVFLEGTYVTNVSTEQPVYFVLSNYGAYFLTKKSGAKHADAKSEPEKFFRLANSFQLSSLTRIVIGLGRHYLIFHINTTMSTFFEASSFILLLRDSDICSEILSKLRQIGELGSLIQDCSWALDNVRNQVLDEEDPGKLMEGNDFLKNFTLGYRILRKNIKKSRPRSLVITTDWVYLCRERFETYLDHDKGITTEPQFEVTLSRPIVEIISIEIADSPRFHVRVVFDSTGHNEKSNNDNNHLESDDNHHDALFNHGKSHKREDDEEEDEDDDDTASRHKRSEGEDAESADEEEEEEEEDEKAETRSLVSFIPTQLYRNFNGRNSSLRLFSDFVGAKRNKKRDDNRWNLRMCSVRSRQQFIDTLARLWKELFKVDLTINFVSR